MQERKANKTAVNFKDLYNKKYGDIVKISERVPYTPEQVFDLVVRYFTWAEENAIVAAETASYQGVVTEHRIHKSRVFTINGLCLFCGFSKSVWDKWKCEPGFSEVINFADTVIREQKFQLAANEMVNPNFIARDLGMTDTAVNVENNSTVQTINEVSADEVKSAVEDVLKNL